MRKLLLFTMVFLAGCVPSGIGHPPTQEPIPEPAKPTVVPVYKPLPKKVARIVEDAADAERGGIMFIAMGEARINDINLVAARVSNLQKAVKILEDDPTPTGMRDTQLLIVKLRLVLKSLTTKHTVTRVRLPEYP